MSALEASDGNHEATKIHEDTNYFVQEASQNDARASVAQAFRPASAPVTFYQATLRSYSQVLRPGMTRKDVESYLRNNDKPFQQMCCMERSAKNAYDDLTKIGEESHPWFCSAHNLYIGFAFVSADSHQLPEAHESDTLTKVMIFHWLEECL